MGSPNEMNNYHNNGHAGGMEHQRSQKATFSGLTTLIGVVALIIDIISIATPHWGAYRPVGASYYASGYTVQDNSGHFGPFQSCKYQAYYTYCGGSNHYQATAWLILAGVCAIISVIALGLFCLFSALHVAMQLQRREIMVSFSRAVFLKLLTSSVAVLGTFGSVVFGGVHFAVGGRHNALHLSMGIMYHLQIVLVVITILLVILSYLSWKKAKKHPLPIVPRNQGSSYEVRNGNGVSMTQASGSPYPSSYRHGQPRFPNQPQPQVPSYSHSNYIQQPPQGYAPQGCINNGFQPVSLSVPTDEAMSAMPMQPIRPIQPVQGIPQPSSSHSSSSPPMGMVSSMAPMPTAGVSFAPGGKSGTGGAGYSVQMGGNGFGGSMESLQSTNSSNLSNISFSSTVSTGSGHHPLRSSLKKPKNRDKVSISSESSSKRVRLSLGAEQTSV